MKIIELEEVDSTNEYCKRVDCCEDIIVVASRQNRGKGTKGRSFSSGDGGLYVSIMRRFESFPAENAFKIMVSGCVAVCRTLEKFGVTPVIRWSNDVFSGGRKISGTLIENTFSGGKITRSILGTGINVNNEIPAELKEIAVSMKEIAGQTLPFKDVKVEFISQLQREFSISDYKKYINWLGKTVTLKTAEGEISALALDIADDGRFIAKVDGKVRKISSAEVSLRI